MRQAKKYWFAESPTRMALLAQDPDGKIHRVTTAKKNEPPFKTEHRLIIRMQKIHELTTEY